MTGLPNFINKTSLQAGIYFIDSKDDRDARAIVIGEVLPKTTFGPQNSLIIVYFNKNQKRTMGSIASAFKYKALLLGGIRC